MFVNPNNKEKFLMSLSPKRQEDVDGFQNGQIKILLKKFHDENWIGKFNKDQNLFRLDCRLIFSNFLFTVHVRLFPKNYCDKEDLSQKIFTEIEIDKEIHASCCVREFDDLALKNPSPEILYALA